MLPRVISLPLLVWNGNISLVAEKSELTSANYNSSLYIDGTWPLAIINQSMPDLPVSSIAYLTSSFGLLP